MEKKKSENGRLFILLYFLRRVCIEKSYCILWKENKKEYIPIDRADELAHELCIKCQKGKCIQKLYIYAN